MPCQTVTAARLQPWQPPSRRTCANPSTHSDQLHPAAMAGDGRVDLLFEHAANPIRQINGLVVSDRLSFGPIEAYGGHVR